MEMIQHIGQGKRESLSSWKCRKDYQKFSSEADSDIENKPITEIMVPRLQKVQSAWFLAMDDDATQEDIERDHMFSIDAEYFEG